MKKTKAPSTNKMNCLKCGKWFTEDNLIITPKGAFCEECYYE